MRWSEIFVIVKEQGHLRTNPPATVKACYAAMRVLHFNMLVNSFFIYRNFKQIK